MLNQSFIRATEKNLALNRSVPIPSVDVPLNEIQEAINTFTPRVTSITGVHNTTTLTIPLTCSQNGIETVFIKGLSNRIYTPGHHNKHIQVDAFIETLYPNFGVSSANHWVFLDVTAAPNTAWQAAIAIPSQGLYFQADPFTPQTVCLTETAHNNYKAVETGKANLIERNATAEGYIKTMSERYYPPIEDTYLLRRDKSATNTTAGAIVTNNFTWNAENISPFHADGLYVFSRNGLYGFRASVHFTGVWVFSANITLNLTNRDGTSLLRKAETKWKSLTQGTKHHMMTFQPHTIYHRINNNTSVTWHLQCNSQYQNFGSTYANTYGPPKVLVEFELIPQIMVSRPLVTAPVSVNEVPDGIIPDPDLPIDGTVTPADPDPVPTLTNWEFPTDMEPLMTYLGGATFTDADCIVALPNGYRLEVSSYANTRGAKNLFNLTTTAWRNAGLGTPVYTTNRLPQLAYTQRAYTDTNPAVYQGGGNTANFFEHALIEEDSVLITGEYFAVTLPFDCTLKAVKIMPATGLFAQCAGELCILGSNDGGITWSYVADMLFENYTENEFTTVNSLHNGKFRMFRAVITQLYGVANYTSIQRAAFVFDTWDTPPVPIVPYTESIQFPDAYTALVSYLQSVNLNDSVLTSLAGDYEMEISSYNPLYPVADLFDQLITQFRCAAPGTATNYRKGVAWANAYTQQPYLNGVYQGGGHASNTFTSSTATTTYAGEFIQITVPFACQLKTMHVQAFNSNPGNAPRNYVILAKNVGDSVWTLLANITQTSYTAGVYKDTTIAATGSSYTIYRMVILTLIDPVTIYLLRNVKYTFVTYSEPPEPIF